MNGNVPATKAGRIEALVPVGIPMGHQPAADPDIASQRWDSAYAVRAGGRFCILDAEDHLLWSAASAGASEEALVSECSRFLQVDRANIQLRVHALRESLLLASLSASTEADRDVAGALRVVPRAIVNSYRPGHPASYTLRIGSGSPDLELDPLAYTIWTFWDGALPMAEAVGAVSRATGMSPDAVQRRCFGLLLRCIRAQAVFIDIRPPSGH